MTKELHDVDPNTLREWLEQDSVCLIDVREPYEYNLERISGAKLLPTSTFSPDQLPEGESRPFLFYCKAGVRSARAAEAYMATGPDKSYHLEGGIDFWVQSGMPTEKKRSAVISLERQMQIVLGVVILLLSLLTWQVTPYALGAVALLGVALILAGATGICGLTILLAKMPHNQR